MFCEVFAFLGDLSASIRCREAHPFGPDKDGSFAYDLAIEADKLSIGSHLEAVAVTSGAIRFIPGPGDSGSLALKPDRAAAEEINRATGLGEDLIFVYRNLSRSSVGRAASNREKKFFPYIPEDMCQGKAEALADGRKSLYLDAGDLLGSSAQEGGQNPWIGFEIVCTPYIDDELFDRCWRRVKELIDPGSFECMRLDPASFYSAILQERGHVRMHRSHKDHPLFTMMTRRTLIEIRDEYNMPFYGPVEISLEGERAKEDKVNPVVKGSNGIFAVDTAPPGESCQSRAYAISSPGHLLTRIPSGRSASRTIKASLRPPSHLAVQAIFLPDGEASSKDNQRCWFVENDCRSLLRFTEGNRLTPIIDGRELFSQYVQAMQTVLDSEHYAYLSSWSLDDRFPLMPENPDTCFGTLARRASETGRFRALLWSRAGVAIDEVNRINGLNGGNGGRAILDGDTLFLGSHHQKFLVIKGDFGPLAFCGGMDIVPNRLDSPSHGAPGPFHDVHARVEGPAVQEIHRCFVERWNTNPFRTEEIDAAAPEVDPEAGSVYVQVACTYAPRAKYPFAPQGSLTALKAFVRAIEKAKKFIYIEDQYMTPYPGRSPGTGRGDSVGILTALRSALERIDYLILVMPNHTDLPQYRFRRQQFIEALRAVDSSKVFAFYLARDKAVPGKGEVASSGGCITCSGGPMYRNEIYCHSKTWIVDDICAKIGSCNCSRRSYTYDSEMDLVAVDGAIQGFARSFALSYRLELWSEHLNLAKERSMVLEDHKIALSFWLSPPRGAHIRPYDHSSEIDLINTDLAWDSVIDPDGR